MTAVAWFLLATHDARLIPAFGAVEMPATSYYKGLTWLGHASFKLVRGGVTIYLDPWQVTGEPHDADLVLITHPHFDHLSAADVAKVVKPLDSQGKPQATIVTVADCAEDLKKAEIPTEMTVVKPGDFLETKGVRIEAVPAYNTNKTFHPKEKEWVGFIVEIDGARIYHAGDTDQIPEMANLKVDVALLPVSGTYVMTAEEAAQAAKVLNPRVSIPMHYGAIVGTTADAKRFQTLSVGLLVEILLSEKSS